jgi:hypothetical protein
MPFSHRTISDEETFELINNVCRRPRMYYYNAESLRDVVAFISGISCGLNPPHGGLAGVAEFIYQTFPARRDIPWTAVILNEFAHLPFYDACESLGKLFRDFRASLNPKAG